MSDPRIGRTLYDLSNEEYRSLPVGSVVAYKLGVYADEWTKMAERSWCAEEGRRPHPPFGARVVSVGREVPRG